MPISFSLRDNTVVWNLQTLVQHTLGYFPRTSSVWTLRSPTTSSPEYIRKVVYVSDSNLAAELVVEQVGLEFDSEKGKEMPRLEAEKEEFDARYKVSRVQMEQLEKAYKNTLLQ